MSDAPRGAVAWNILSESAILNSQVVVVVQTPWDVQKFHDSIQWSRLATLALGLG